MLGAQDEVVGEKCKTLAFGPVDQRIAYFCAMMEGVRREAKDDEKIATLTECIDKEDPAAEEKMHRFQALPKEQKEKMFERIIKCKEDAMA